MNDQFSVLMSLYEKENPAFLKLCFEGLLNQTMRASEVVLVFDGPITNELEEVVNNFRESLNIKVYKLDINVGLSAALNYGLMNCTEEVVARVDTDDICLPQRFEKQLEVFGTDKSIDICGGFANIIDEAGVVSDSLTVPLTHDDIKKVIWACPMIHPTVMFKKGSIENIGSYSINCPNRQDDYELWIRSMRNGLVFKNIPENLISYRICSGVNKNTFRVGFDRMLIGIKAVYEFDNRFFSYVALLYPMIRALTPYIIQSKLVRLAKYFDPRTSRDL